MIPAIKSKHRAPRVLWSGCLAALGLCGAVPTLLAAPKPRAETVDSNAEVEPAVDSGETRTTATQRETWSADSALGSFTLKSRLFVRAELLREQQTVVNSAGVPVAEKVNSLDLSVPSARVSLRYRSRLKWLFAEIEVDVADKPDMKDGYIRAKEKRFSAQAGQFKMPVSALELESPWMLPVARRGFLSDILLDHLAIAGRRPGLTLGFRGGGVLRPRATVGVFQGDVVVGIEDNTRKTEFISGRGLGAQSGVARAEIEGGPARIGVFYEHRVGTPELFSTDHYWTAGGDLMMAQDFAFGGLRLWVDGLAGASWFEHSNKPKDARDATFISGRLLAAPRFGGTEDEDLYVEPFALVGALDPDLDVRRDWAWEVALGVNVGFWRRARLTLQAEKYETLRNFPEAYFLGRNPDRIGLVLQAGVAF